MTNTPMSTSLATERERTPSAAAARKAPRVRRARRPGTHARDSRYINPLPDTRPGNYYVSVVQGRRYCLALGPFPDDHARALAGVERVRRYFAEHDLDGFQTCGYGTCRVGGSVNAEAGKLNDAIEPPTDEDVLAYLAANPPRAGHWAVSDPEHWPFRVVEDTLLGTPRFAVIETASGASLASYGEIAPAVHHRRFRTTPSTRMDLVGTGGGRLELIAVGEPCYREGYPRGWVVLARINRELTAAQRDWLTDWVWRTHILVTPEDS